jgi:hypothetical protein
VRRTGRYEPTEVLIHICMETTQGNSMCSYLYLGLAKMSWFSYYHLYVFYKIREQESGTGSAGGCWHQWEWEVAEKGVGK